jgi:NCS1 family nucleobase:cation symporter-1
MVYVLLESWLRPRGIDSMTANEQAMRLESSTIQPIALDQRHGSARDLFTVWFGSNIMMLTIITGALGVTVFKLTFIWAVIALIIGNLFGAIFMALHAAQGPTLGVPQMVQTRGQFGSFGSLLVIALVVIMYVGFFASNLVLGGQSIAAIVPSIDVFDGIVLMGVISVAGAIFGYDLIHAYARLMSWACGLVLVLAFIWIVLVHGLPAGFLQKGSLSFPGLLSAMSVAALWQIAYAPYVSDYSRYMPADTGQKPAFWASYWGCTIGSILPMILGAMVGACIQGEDITAGLALMTDRLAPLVLLVFSVGMLVSNAMNIYCGSLSTLTIGHTLWPKWNPKAGARAVTAVVLLMIALVLALLGKDSFLVKYTDFILLLLYVLVPWTAINLVDYYLVQHGRYDVASFMRADGGIYGRINIAAVGCYLLGILVQVPFFSSPMYAGFAARAMHGADVSWIVGLAVTSPVYYFAARWRGVRTTKAATAIVGAQRCV